MKFVIFSLFILATTWIVGQSTVSQKEFKILMKQKGSQLVDIRTTGELSNGIISGAKHIDYFSKDFIKQCEKSFDKSKPLLVYCAAGGRSGKAIKELKKIGFKKVYDLAGGYDDWID